MSRTVTTTVTMEYDEQGRLVKETTVTSEREWPNTDYLPAWPRTFPAYPRATYTVCGNTAVAK